MEPETQGIQIEKSEAIKSPLKEIRETYGLTQAEFATLAGISSASYVCEVEAGLHPLSDKIIAVLQKAHVNVEEVMEQHEAYMRQTKSRLEEILTTPTGKADGSAQ